MTKRYYILIIVIFVLTGVGLFSSAKHQSNQKVAQANSIEAKEEKIVKEEDRAPLIAPQGAVLGANATRVPILMYHHIGTAPLNTNATRKDLTVSPTEFESQVEWLSKNGYTAVTLDDLYQYIQKKKTDWPAKPVIFTFDDGYSDVFENAVPILTKYHFVGAFGIITNYPGQTQGDNVYATWDQISSAKTAGMEIVCHTQNHFDGSSPKFTNDYVFQNLSGCQQDLIAHLKTAEPYLIYPYGHYTEGYISEANRAGFVMALTVHFGNIIYHQDLMRMPRVRIHPNEPLEKFVKIISE